MHGAAPSARRQRDVTHVGGAGSPANETEREGLLDIRMRRRWVWRIWIGALPAVFLASFAGDRIAIGAVAAVGVLWVAVVVRAGLARCPRCGEFFDRGRVGSWNPWRQACGSCRLPLDEHCEESAATDYSRDWRRLHRLWVAQTLMWLLFLPVIALLAMARRLSTAFETPAVVIGLTWMVAIVVTSIRGASFRCPHCAKLFFIKGLVTRGLFTRETKRVCAHCGLAVGG